MSKLLAVFKIMYLYHFGSVSVFYHVAVQHALIKASKLLLHRNDQCCNGLLKQSVADRVSMVAFIVRAQLGILKLSPTLTRMQCVARSLPCGPALQDDRRPVHPVR